MLEHGRTFACSTRASRRVKLQLGIRPIVHAFAWHTSVDTRAELHTSWASAISTGPEGTTIASGLHNHQFMAASIAIASTRRVVVVRFVTVEVAVLQELEGGDASGSYSLRQPGLNRFVALIVVIVAVART